MQITLICQYETGSIACNGARIDGVEVNERHYYIVNHQVVLEGDNETVIHHDVDELLAMDGGIYRLPTPKEQNAIAKAQQESSSVQEDAPKAPDAPQAPDSGSKPKNGG